MDRLVLRTKQETVIDHRWCGADVRQARINKQVRLMDLAIALGISTTQMSRLERGEAEWSAELLEKVSETLSCM